MKSALIVLVARLLTTTGTRSGVIPEKFSADSSAAQKLLSQSRVLEDYFEESAIASYSVVFEGCHMDSSWSEDGYSSVGVVTYSLCPSGYCSEYNGCTSSYKGKYAVSLETFLDAYLEARLEKMQYKCERMREDCGCDGDGDDCVWNCFKNYDDDTLDWTFCQDEQDEMARMAECQLLEIEEEDEERRLDYYGDQAYYIGPICGSSGKGVYLTLFSDEECQTEVSNSKYVYYNLAGEYHPNFSTSLVNNECTSCLEPKDEQEQNDDDMEDRDEVTRYCEDIYYESVKCETYMSDIAYPDESGCSYISSLGRRGRLLAAASSISSSNGGTVFFFITVLAVGAALLVTKGIKKNM